MEEESRVSEEIVAGGRTRVFRLSFRRPFSVTQRLSEIGVTEADDPVYRVYRVKEAPSDGGASFKVAATGSERRVASRRRCQVSFQRKDPSTSSVFVGISTSISR